MKFESLRLAEPILRAVAAEQYLTPTPIQTKSIPHILEGKDLLGCAQTGTGKTAAFALPILHLLTATAPEPAPAPAPAAANSHAARSHHAPTHGRAHHPEPARPASRKPRVLVLCPTRELALQIGESFRVYGRFTGIKHTCIFGGVGQGAQVAALRHGVDILVATPGRLMDLMEQGHVDLTHVGIFVLDEADRMLDMGFIADIRRIVTKLPRARQSLLFSATMPPEIRRLADGLLSHPVSVEVAAVAKTTDLIEQSVYMVSRRDKSSLLASILDEAPEARRTLVFARTKHGADRIVKELASVGIRSEAIHGNKRQNVRQRTLEQFRTGKTMVLVATDIAARGIDIDDIALVINYDLPDVPETYVHRIGRTGRAGATGRAAAFCDHDERPLLKAIERLIRMPIQVVAPSAEAVAARSTRPTIAAPDRRSSQEHRQRPMRQRNERHPRGSTDGRPQRSSGGPAKAASHPHGNHAPRSAADQHIGEGTRRSHSNTSDRPALGMGQRGRGVRTPPRGSGSGRGRGSRGQGR